MIITNNAHDYGVYIYIYMFFNENINYIIVNYGIEVMLIVKMIFIAFTLPLVQSQSWPYNKNFQIRICIFTLQTIFIYLYILYAAQTRLLEIDGLKLVLIANN